MLALNNRGSGSLAELTAAYETATVISEESSRDHAGQFKRCCRDAEKVLWNLLELYSMRA